MAKEKDTKKATKKSGEVEIRLVALGEVSELTGGKFVKQGEKIGVSAKDAARAVKSGRWELIEDEGPDDGEGTGEGEGTGAGEGGGETNPES